MLRPRKSVGLLLVLSYWVEGKRDCFLDVAKFKYLY